MRTLIVFCCSKLFKKHRISRIKPHSVNNNYKLFCVRPSVCQQTLLLDYFVYWIDEILFTFKLMDLSSHDIRITVSQKMFCRMFFFSFSSELRIIFDNIVIILTCVVVFLEAFSVYWCVANARILFTKFARGTWLFYFNYTG